MCLFLNYLQNVVGFQPQVPGGQPERGARCLPDVRAQRDGGQDGERGRIQQIQDLKCNTQMQTNPCCISQHTQKT